METCAHCSHILETTAPGFLAPILSGAVGWLYVSSLWWTAIGFAGALIFGSRFVFQWIQSEKSKRLVVPNYFWHLSFCGSTLNFLYAMHLDKAPLILGSCFLPFLYGRNLVLLYRGSSQALVSEHDAGDRAE